MSAVLEAMRDKPLVYCPMNDTAPYDDYSGYGRNGVLTGSAGRHIGLVAGMSQAAILGGTNTVAFDSPVFRQGFEKQSFTLEAMAYPLGITHRENLVRDPSFEAGGIWTMYNAAGNTAPTMNYVGSPGVTTGSQAVRLVTSDQAAGAGNRLGVTQQLNNLKGDTEYTVGVDLTVNGAMPAGKRFSIYLDIQNSTGTWLGARYLYIDNPTSGRKTFTFTSYTGSDRATFYIWIDGNGGAGALDFCLDSVSVIQGPQDSYFDGGMAGYQWTGAAGTSSSRTNPAVQQKNLSVNPRATRNFGFQANNAWWSMSHNQTITDHPLGITTAAKSTVVHANAGRTVLSIYNADGLGMHPAWRGLGAWVMTPHSGYEANFIGRGGSHVPLAPNEWKFITCAPGSSWASIEIRKINAGETAAMGDVAYVTGVIATDFVRPYEFFDGESSGAQWVGVANQSASIKTTAAQQQVLGTLNNMDGLVVEGTKVHFVTKYLTAGEARCTYDLQQNRAVRAAGVHTKDRNALYVDGKLVAEVSINEAQQADQFRATDGKLYSSAGGSDSRVAVNGIGIYGTALPKESINRHYIISQQVPESEDVAESNGADVLPISLAHADVFLDQWWSTADDWNAATLTNVAVTNDRLVPQFSGDTSIAGSWVDTFGLEAAQTTSMYGVVLNWDGEGATVQVSLDGTSWETVSRGVRASTIPDGFDPTDKVLLVRVQFPGGITNDASYIDNLNVVGLSSNVTPSTAGRVLTLTNASPERDYPALQLHDNWGLQIDAGGSLVISADTSTDAVPVRVLELWIKRTSDTAPTFSISGTSYVDGQAGSTLNRDQWHLMHIVAAADVTGAITITGTAQIGQVALYETTMDAARVAEVFAEYTSSDILQVRDASVISLQESAQAVNIYAHDWSISASG